MDHRREHRTPPLARVMGVGTQQQQHKIIFTYLINNSDKIKKFIKAEKNDKVSIKRFADELKNLNIYDKMNKNINCCPQDNYEVLASLVKFAKEKNVYPLK